MGQHIGKRKATLSQRFKNAKYPNDQLNANSSTLIASSSNSNQVSGWVCPESVYEVHVVAIGGGGGGHAAPFTGTTTPGGNSYFIDTNTVAGFGGSEANMSGGVVAPAGGFVGDGGGHGGFGNYIAAGTGGRGGGAGGYSANGSPGATSSTDSLDPGGGAGAGGGQNVSRPGGGVGAFGEGVSGINGTAGSGGSRADTQGVNYVSVSKEYGGGGGGRASGSGGAGGGLGWKNNIPVIPGRTYTIQVGGRGESNSQQFLYSGGYGAVRVISGDNRSFPDNAT